MCRLFVSGSVSCCLLLAGCRSKYVQATITNNSGAPLHVIQVEYPSASFGTQDLAPGASFRYRFLLLGSGPVKLTFNDAGMREHQQTGPELHEGEQGTLAITFPSQERANFAADVHP